MKKHCIAMLLAGGQGSRLYALTAKVAKPSLPFGGKYRIIDFPLSNMMNAGIKTVGVVMPGNYRSLIDHVGSGKDWGLDRKKGGLFMVPGNAYGTTKGGMRFLLRDIISNKTLFQRSEIGFCLP